jgi:hypothetical protein
MSATLFQFQNRLNVEFRGVWTNQLLDKHLVAGNSRTVPGMPFLLRDKDFDSSCNCRHNAIHLAQRRGNGSLHRFARLFYLVDSSAQEFVGTNNLEPGTIDGVSDGGIDAVDLVLYRSRRLRNVGADFLDLDRNRVDLRTQISNRPLHGLDQRHGFDLHFLGQSFHFGRGLAKGQKKADQNPGLNQYRKRSNRNKNS